MIAVIFRFGRYGIVAHRRLETHYEMVKSRLEVILEDALKLVKEQPVLFWERMYRYNHKQLIEFVTLRNLAEIKKQEIIDLLKEAHREYQKAQRRSKRVPDSENESGVSDIGECDES